MQRSVLEDHRATMHSQRNTAILSLFLTCACGGEESAARWQGSIDSLASGTVVVMNPATGIWPPNESWTLEQDLRLGKTEDEGPDVFGDIEAFAVAANGDLFVLDGQAQDIRQFDNKGKFLRTIGRRGSGPGEFTMAFGLGFDPRGRLWVADLGSHRYSVFDTTGKLLRVQRTPMAGFAPPWSGMFDAEGRVYDWDVGVTADGRIRLTALRMDTVGQIDTIRFLSYHVSMVKGLPPDTAFAARTIARIDAGGRIWSGNMQRYSLAQTTASGDTLRIIERALDPLPMRAAEKDSILQRYSKSLRLDRSDIPDHRLAFESFGFTGDGHLIVQLVTAPTARESIFDVFDREGRYLGQMKTSSRLAAWPAPQVHGDHLIGITMNELNVEQVVRYRIVR
jgi:6-bladed beta-propeller protein